jgi:glycine/D-amino acid oxidase-like deaminating enzyme
VPRHDILCGSIALVRAVVTDRGRIECEKVVLCAGQWTRALAATVVRHQRPRGSRIVGVEPDEAGAFPQRAAGAGC